ncbi:hypothetical protein EDD22DRAFT_974568 [Suillus occidentalis]|nr:hypothetical protein EDD22DRAFT_974568 [Suillus occidentalis]
MMALAVAYPMSGEIMGQSSVAKREALEISTYDQTIRAEEEAAGVYFTISYEDKKRGKYSWPSMKMRRLMLPSVATTTVPPRRAATEEEAVGYSSLFYNEGQKRGKYSWPSVTPRF